MAKILFFEAWVHIFRLSWRLALADFRLRNEGSILGNVWFLLNPLLLFGVLYFIFSARIGSDISQYPVFLALGILLYSFFSRTTIDATNAIRDNKIIKSFNFKQEALVLGVVLKHTIAHAVEVLVFFCIFLFFGIPMYALLLYLAVVSIFFLFTYGVSLFLASATMYVTDLRNVWSFFTLLLLFLTPIFYDAGAYAESDTLSLYNPLFYFITAARTVVIDTAIPSGTIIIGMIIATGIALVVGSYIFSAMRCTFAEKI